MNPSAKIDDRGHMVSGHILTTLNFSVEKSYHFLELLLEGLQIVFNLTRDNSQLTVNFDFNVFQADLCPEPADIFRCRRGKPIHNVLMPSAGFLYGRRKP